MKISYAITVHNEHEELATLLSVLSEYIRDEDEIVILRDVNITEEVITVHEKFEEVLDCEYRHDNEHALNRDFASHKNYLNSLCTGEYIFQIDADEYPSNDLIEQLPELLAMNPSTDLYLIPRINTVDGLTADHINRWNWDINDNGWVNFPDNQSRIYKNTSDIYWINMVHERIVGYKTYATLPPMEEYCLFHPKQIARQVAQNELYAEIADDCAL